MNKKNDVSSSVASSSIVDLKAELYRKQLEYQHLKTASGLTDTSFIPGRKAVKKPTIWSRKNPGVNQRNEADEVKHRITGEEEDKLELSRQKLEAKSQLYERLTTTGDNAEDEDGNSLYLVDFEKKFIDNVMEKKEKLAESSSHSKKAAVDDEKIEEFVEDPSQVKEEEEWVDYTDSFGRSRRCMRKDLPKLKALDKNSSKSQDDSRRATSADNSSTLNEPDLCSTDMRKEMLREKWEKEQREMLENQETVHYSNVQFDVLKRRGRKTKGNGKLYKIREDTKSNRAAKERLKEKRKAMLNARLEKVRQRRIAQGKSVPEIKESSSSDDETIGPPAPKNIKPETEPLYEKDPTVIRDWDKGKPGLMVPQHPKKPKSWVNPRDKRDVEFAPPSFYYKDKDSTLQTNSDKNSQAAKRKDAFQSTQHQNLNKQSHVTSYNQSTTLSVTNTVAVEDISLPPDNYSVENIPLPQEHRGSLDNDNDRKHAVSIDAMLKTLRNQSS